jgi:hypothetical protein
MPSFGEKKLFGRGKHDIDGSDQIDSDPENAVERKAITRICDILGITSESEYPFSESSIGTEQTSAKLETKRQTVYFNPQKCKEKSQFSIFRFLVCQCLERHQCKEISFALKQSKVSGPKMKQSPRLWKGAENETEPSRTV